MITFDERLFLEYVAECNIVSVLGIYPVISDKTPIVKIGIERRKIKVSLGTNTGIMKLVKIVNVRDAVQK
jgi:hypothetical protein